MRQEQGCPGNSRCDKLRVNMTASLPADQLPLELHVDGVIRVGGTRVTLDTIMTAYRNGASAEQIAESWPAVSLGDIYEAIGYALRHSHEIESYLTAREASAALVKEENLRRFPQEGLRARLLARADNGARD